MTRAFSFNLLHLDPARDWNGKRVQVRRLSDFLVDSDQDRAYIGPTAHYTISANTVTGSVPVPDAEDQAYRYEFSFPGGEKVTAPISQGETFGITQLLNYSGASAGEPAFFPIGPDDLQPIPLSKLESIVGPAVLGRLSGNGAVSAVEVLALLLASGFYSAGTWTPRLSCINPGDLSLNNAFPPVGLYVRSGAKVTCWFKLQTTITHTNASGLLTLNDFPYAAVPQTDAIQFGELHQTGGLAATSTRHVQRCLMPTSGGNWCVFYSKDPLSVSPSQYAIRENGTIYTLSGEVNYYTND